MYNEVLSNLDAKVGRINWKLLVKNPFKNSKSTISEFKMQTEPYIIDSTLFQWGFSSHSIRATIGFQSFIYKYITELMKTSIVKNNKVKSEFKTVQPLEMTNIRGSVKCLKS